MKQSAGINYNIELLANVLSQGYSKKNGTQGTEVVFVASSWIASSYMAIIGDVRSMQLRILK